MSDTKENSTKKKNILNSANIQTLEKLLSDMQYGTVAMIVQDGRIVQIDKTEKYRM